MFKYSLVPVLNKQRPDKNKRYPLRIRATVKGKVVYYPTGIMLAEAHWDADNKRVIVHPQKTLLNASIGDSINSIEKQFLERHLSGGEATKEIVKDFFKYAYLKIKKGAEQQAANTTRQKTSSIDKFKEFRPRLNVDQVTPELLYKYEQYCRDLGNKDNTIWKSIKEVKTIVNLAIFEGLAKPDQLAKYKRVKYTSPERLYLTAPEVDKLEALVKNDDVPVSYRTAANWFLFSCYCGLRYGDAAAFTRDKIVNGKIVLRTTKTGADVSIKMHAKLAEAVNRLGRPLTSNQDYNRALKAVAAIAQIHKPLTSHIARHTFAVQFLERGGSIEVLSKLLGHSTMKVTQIYGKITDLRIDDEIDRVFK